MQAVVRADGLPAASPQPRSHDQRQREAHGRARPRSTGARARARCRGGCRAAGSGCRRRSDAGTPTAKPISDELRERMREAPPSSPRSDSGEARLAGHAAEQQRDADQEQQRAGHPVQDRHDAGQRQPDSRQVEIDRALLSRFGPRTGHGGNHETLAAGHSTRAAANPPPALCIAAANYSARHALSSHRERPRRAVVLARSGSCAWPRHRLSRAR